MARTESISFQVHPDDEQQQINHMQEFYWNLLSSQEVKTVDTHEEVRGDSVYNVKNTEHYVKLTFQRDLSTPHISEIKDLEKQYNSLSRPNFPKLFPVGWFLWAVLALFYGLGVVLWLVYFFALYKPKQKAAEELAAENERKRAEIMRELKKLDVS